MTELAVECCHKFDGIRIEREISIGGASRVVDSLSELVRVTIGAKTVCDPHCSELLKCF